MGSSEDEFAAFVLASRRRLCRVAYLICGDAHLANFGAFASPERRLVFDINDFDETHPGPFEWDVKRLATSLWVAGQQAGFDRHDRREIVGAMAARYRTTMREFADRSQLEVWNARLDVDDTITALRSELRPKLRGGLAEAAHEIGHIPQLAVVRDAFRRLQRELER